MSFARLIKLGVEEYIRNHGEGLPRELTENPLTARETLVIERFVRLSLTTQPDFLHLMDDFLEPFAPQGEDGEAQGYSVESAT